MPVPTVSSITPNIGLTGGRLLVEIIGTNFQLLPAPPPTGQVLTVPNPSVEVLFGTEKGLKARVLSSTRLHVDTPISVLVDADGHPTTGAVNVTVRNIDQAGVVIPGETVTVTNGFTYIRPVLETTPAGGGGTTVESDLVRLVRATMRELQRQVHPNVELTVHTDYDDSPTGGANIAMLSSLPGLVLSGPSLRENRFFSQNQPRSKSLGGGNHRELRPAYTVDLVFTLIGVDDNTIRLINLQSACTSFFQRNKFLRMLRDPAVAGDFVEYELEIMPDGDFDLASAEPGNSNLRSFSGSFVVRGLDIDDQQDVSRLQTTELVDQVGAGVSTPSPIILTTEQIP